MFCAYLVDMLQGGRRSERTADRAKGYFLAVVVVAWFNCLEYRQFTSALNVFQEYLNRFDPYVVDLLSQASNGWMGLVAYIHSFFLFKS